MILQSPSTTPSCVSAVSPVQWLHAFAYTPDSARVRNGSKHPELTVDHRIPLRDEDSDVLPTRFHSRGVVGGAPNPGRGAVRDGAGASVSDPRLMVPRKRKRQSGGREALSSASTSDGLSATHGSSSQLRTDKTRSRTRCTSPSRGSGHGQFHAPAPSRRAGSRRVVLDAVEIVSKKRSRTRMADSTTVRAECPTGSARKTASSHYPSPPVSHAPRHIAVYDSHSSAHVLHPNAVAGNECSRPELTLPLKTSKYFTPLSPPLTRSVSERFPVLTPPSSPMLTIPVYIESSDFEYPPLEDSFVEPVEGTVNQSRRVPTWYDSPGLFDDLMIMLRRLKPILVQESVRDDPWKVLIAVRLLNVTTGKAAIPVFCKIISRWPTPQDLVHAPQNELVELLRPLGLYNKRARWLKDVSERFLEDRPTPSCPGTSLTSPPSDERIARAEPHLHYPGVGPYALDSLRIFCVGDKDEWKRVMPQDKELVRYLRWRWVVEEGKVWYPGGTGVIGEVDVPYLITLVDELAAHYDGVIGGEGYMYHFCNDLCSVLDGNATG